MLETVHSYFYLLTLLVDNASSGWSCRLFFVPSKNTTTTKTKEPCEIDSRQEFPLLHSTIEVSSIPLPKWLSTEKGDSPRLLRLLVVWPSPPVDPLRTFKVDTDLPLREFLIDPNVTSDCNSRFARANTFEESELTIRKCLEVGNLTLNSFVVVAVVLSLGLLKEKYRL